MSEDKVKREVEKVTKQKDPKKVEAGKKGHQVKLLKMKEQILKESVPRTSSSNSGSIADTGSSPGSRSYNPHVQRWRIIDLGDSL